MHSTASNPDQSIGAYEPATDASHADCGVTVIPGHLAKLPCLLGSVNCMPGQGIKRLWTSPASPVKGRSSLKVLQWNVLADGLAQHGNFVKVRVIGSGLRC